MADLHSINLTVRPSISTQIEFWILGPFSTQDGTWLLEQKCLLGAWQLDHADMPSLSPHP
jgi:cytochrome oxidase assembly protein ShyY1